MAFILDMAPVHQGRTADIGYSGCLGLNPVHDRLLADLEAHRELILREVRERRPLREIYEDVERLMIRQGHANRHRATLRRDRPQDRPGEGAPLVTHGLRVRHAGVKGLASDALHGHRDAGRRCGARTSSPTTRRSRGCGRSNRTSDSGARARSSRRSSS